MKDSPSPPASSGVASGQPVIAHQPPPPPPPKRRWFLKLLLIISVLINVGMYAQYSEYFADAQLPRERFYSGDETASDKIAVISVTGTIMPPFTGRILNAIQRATEDDAVKGVVLTVDSPGGLVADSHQIYHKLIQLREKKPIVVSMKRLAASGGYYIAMGVGPNGMIFAEPTTWTGSIGVIIPRYNLTELVEKIGLTVEPLKTGEFKDALSPFQDLSPQERAIWEHILDDSFQRFLGVIADCRSKLGRDRIGELATGQIFTANDALKNGLVDEIGYEEDAIEYLRQLLQLDRARIVTYRSQPAILELLTESSQTGRTNLVWQQLLEATVPQALYLCSGIPILPTR